MSRDFSQLPPEVFNAQGIQVNINLVGDYLYNALMITGVKDRAEFDKLAPIAFDGLKDAFPDGLMHGLLPEHWEAIRTRMLSPERELLSPRRVVKLSATVRVAMDVLAETARRIREVSP